MCALAPSSPRAGSASLAGDAYKDEAAEEASRLPQQTAAPHEHDPAAQRGPAAARDTRQDLDAATLRAAQFVLDGEAESAPAPMPRHVDCRSQGPDDARDAGVRGSSLISADDAAPGTSGRLDNCRCSVPRLESRKRRIAGGLRTERYAQDGSTHRHSDSTPIPEPRAHRRAHRFPMVFQLRRETTRHRQLRNSGTRLKSSVSGLSARPWSTKRHAPSSIAATHALTAV